MLFKGMLEFIKDDFDDVIYSYDFEDFFGNIMLVCLDIFFSIFALFVDILLIPFELIILIMWLIKEKIFD